MATADAFVLACPSPAVGLIVNVPLSLALGYDVAGLCPVSSHPFGPSVVNKRGQARQNWLLAANRRL
jgi:hypothetical protein